MIFLGTVARRFFVGDVSGNDFMPGSPKIKTSLDQVEGLIEDMHASPLAGHRKFCKPRTIGSTCRANEQVTNKHQWILKTGPGQSCLVIVFLQRLRHATAVSRLTILS